MRWLLRKIVRYGATAALLMAGIGLPALAQGAWQDGPAALVLVDAPASYLGVNIRDVDEHSAKLLGLKSTQGVEVIAVDHDAPAGKVGIRLRDVIITVDGKAVTSANQFRATMRAFPPGRQVNLGVLRDGKPLRFFVKLADRVKLQKQALLQHFNVPMPEVGSSFSNAVAMQQEQGQNDGDDGDVVVARPYRIGAILNPIGPQLAAFFGVKDGTGMLVMSVEDGGPAALAGLHAGDVILKLNDEALVSPLDWMRGMQAAQDRPIQLTIVREKRVQLLTIAPPKTQAWMDGMPFPPVVTLAIEQVRREMREFPFSSL
jgi:S1-C subfamily serine protease